MTCFSVAAARLAVRYAFLVIWTQLRRECIGAAEKWPLSLSRKAVTAEWLAVATGPGPKGWLPMTYSNERGQTPQAFIASVAGDVPDPIGAISIGVGNASLLGGDMTDPEDDVVGKGSYAQDLPEDELRPQKGNWVDIFRCNVDGRDGSPLRESPRNATVLFASFTSADMAKVASPADARKIRAKLKGQKIGIAHFPRQAKAYKWYRIAVYSCINPNSMAVANPARPPGFLPACRRSSGRASGSGAT